MSNESPWLTLADAAAYEKRGKRWLAKEAKAGRVRHAVVGGRRELLFRVEWLDEHVESMVQPLNRRACPEARMRDVIGRYRRVYPRLWRHPAFKKLAPLSQRLTTYLLYGPQSNRIGLFYFSINTAAEDLDSTPESLRKALREVALSFGWSFDAIARVFFIPSWWRWNSPDHEKVLRGNLKDLHEIPPCGLTDQFTKNLRYLKPELHKTFIVACRIASGEATPSQYQKQDQDQEPSALRAVPRKKKAITEQPHNGTTSPLVALAHKTLTLLGNTKISITS